MKTSCGKRELGVEPVLLDFKMLPYSMTLRTGLLEETGNSLFFYVLSNVSSFSLGCSSLESSGTNSVCSYRDASLKEWKARTCLIYSSANKYNLLT